MLCRPRTRAHTHSQPLLPRPHTCCRSAVDLYVEQYCQACGQLFFLGARETADRFSATQTEGGGGGPGGASAGAAGAGEAGVLESLCTIL